MRLGDGRTIEAEALVLAPGNQAPDELPFARDLTAELFAADPWGPAGRAAIAKAVASGGDVLAVGSGLSMIDVALSLDAAGHEGKLVAVSRRGQRPRIHLDKMSEVPSSDAAPSGSLRDLWRWVRQRTGEVDGRDAVVLAAAHDCAVAHLTDRTLHAHEGILERARHRMRPRRGRIVER